jgi:hypothetical protein
MAEFQKLDAKSKLNLIDILFKNTIKEIKLSNEMSKRNNRNSERKRPGWELAYGK